MKPALSRALVRALALAGAAFLASCAARDFSTVSNPAALHLEWTGSGLNYDRMNFVSAEKTGDVEHQMRGSQGPFLLDPGDHRLSFRYFGNRGSLGAMAKNLRTSEVGIVKARLEGGRDYLVRSSAAGSSVSFSVVEQATGRVVGRSSPAPTRPLPIKIGPMPYMPVRVY